MQVEILMKWLKSRKEIISNTCKDDDVRKACIGCVDWVNSMLERNVFKGDIKKDILGFIKNVLRGSNIDIFERMFFEELELQISYGVFDSVDNCKKFTSMCKRFVESGLSHQEIFVVLQDRVSRGLSVGDL